MKPEEIKDILGCSAETIVRAHITTKRNDGNIGFYEAVRAVEFVVDGFKNCAKKYAKKFTGLSFQKADCIILLDRLEKEKDKAIMDRYFTHDASNRGRWASRAVVEGYNRFMEHYKERKIFLEGKISSAEYKQNKL